VLKGREPGSITRVPAPEIEALVIGALRSTTPASEQAQSDAELIAAHLRTVTVHPDRLELERMGGEADEADRGEDGRTLQLAWSHVPAQRRREIILPPGSASKLRPMKAEDRSRIPHALATARSWLDDLIAAEIESTDEIASREGCSERSVRMTLSLASLSPQIIKAIIEGRLPRDRHEAPRRTDPGPSSMPPSGSEPRLDAPVGNPALVADDVAAKHGPGASRDLTFDHTKAGDPRRAAPVEGLEENGQDVGGENAGPNMAALTDLPHDGVSRAGLLDLSPSAIGLVRSRAIPLHAIHPFNGLSACRHPEGEHGEKCNQHPALPIRHDARLQ